MIIEKAIAAGDVVGFKIANGEEVIGRLVSVSADKVVLNKIIQTQQVQGPDGGMGLAFGAFLPAIADEKITFRMSGLITEPARVRKEVADSYIGATSSLTVPDTGLVV